MPTPLAAAHSTLTITLWIVGALVVLAIVAGYLGRLFIKRGLREPFVVRTYTDAYLWRVAGDDVAAALRRAPFRFALPLEQQGEGIAFDGDRLLVDSEGLASPVYAVPLPKRAG